MKQILFSECIPNFLLYECFAMHMMTCQVLVLGQNTRGVTLVAQMTGLTNTERQVISRKIPEPILSDRTRPVKDDLLARLCSRGSSPPAPTAAATAPPRMPAVAVGTSFAAAQDEQGAATPEADRGRSAAM